MNRPIRRVAIGCLSLILILLVADNIVQVVAAQSLRDRPENGRQLVARLSHERGAIVVDGKPVAESVPVNDEYKFQRTYPGGSLYAHETGYYTLFTATGIEKSEDDVLSGDDPRLFVRRVSDLLTGRKPKGGAVVLTLDPRAQQAAANALGGKRGAVVAIDPQSGAILAMYSSPSFDPNPLASHNGRSAQAAFNALQNDPGAPLLNRATSATYPPGSTFKVITAAAALSSGKYQTDTQVPSPSALRLPGTSTDLHNFGGEVCGNGQTTSLQQALVISCNTAFANVGLDVGADALRKQAKAFGFNSTIPDFSVGQAKSIYPDSVNRPQTALSAIGQYEVRVTPLQMAMVAAAVANGGRMMKPYLVKETLGPDLTPLSSTSPDELGRPISGDVADKLNTMMRAVVDQGTGTQAKVPGVPTAGKTGTAEHGEGQPPHAWFIGFAPADNPKVAVAVVVEDGGGELSATGGAVAAPIAEQVMAAVLGAG